MLRRSSLLLGTFVIGCLVGYAWRSFPLLQVRAEGELQFEAPQDPAVTPGYPPGYYVLSRVYLSEVDASLLGKHIFTTTALGTHKHPETLAYPLVSLTRTAEASK